MKGELRAYRKRGPDRRQRVFLELLQDSEGRTVLDIGCGIGALGLSLLVGGAAHSTFVDVSGDYLGAARALVNERGFGSDAKFVQADFTQSDLPPADIVLLDRVACCYPDAPTLLRQAASQSQEYLVFSYPRPAWWMRLLQRFLNLTMRVWRKAYRFYVHEREALLAAASSAGHTLQVERNVGIWKLVVYKR